MAAADEEEDFDGKLARAKKLGREAKQARIRQRMRQNAFVTNFITTLRVCALLRVYFTHSL